MKKMRISAIVLAFSLMASSVANAAFTDMPQDTKTSAAIENAVKNGILSGYEDGTVKPDDNITRAQMASIITRACVVSKEADISAYSDVSADAWYHSAMAKAFQMGAFKGDDQMHMNPENNITFQECFTVLSQVLYLMPEYQHNITQAPSPMPENSYYDINKKRLYDLSVLNNYNDKDSIADWAKVFYAGVVASGGWNGTDGNLTPTAYITRGQFAVVMDNLIKNYIDEPGTYKELLPGNTMVRCNGVILDNVKSDSDLYIADCVKPNEVTINNVELNRLVVRGCAYDNKESVTDVSSIKPTGKFSKIRAIRPYIVIYLADAEFDNFYAAEGVDAIVGNISL